MALSILVNGISYVTAFKNTDVDLFLKGGILYVQYSEAGYIADTHKKQCLYVFLSYCKNCTETLI